MGIGFKDMKTRFSTSPSAIIENALVNSKENLPVEDLDKIPGGFHLCADEPENGYPLLFVSDRFIEILGWSREELKEKFDNKFVLLTHPNDRPRGSISEGPGAAGTSDATNAHSASNASSTPGAAPANSDDAISSTADTNSSRIEDGDKIYRLLGKDGYHWVTGIATTIEIEGKSYVNGTIVDITPFVDSLKKADERYEVLSKDENQKSLIIESFGSIFESMEFVDLEAGTIQKLITLSERKFCLGEKVPAKEDLKQKVAALVSEEHQHFMYEFADFDTFKKRFENGSIFTQEFISKSGDWYRCTLFIVDRDEEGHARSIICCIRIINAEMNKLEAQMNLIQGLSLQYENTYGINGDTGEFVSYRLGQTMSDRYGKQFAAGQYEENMNLYLSNDVYERDRHLFDEVSTLEGMKEVLSQKNSYSFNYRVFRDGVRKYYQCLFVKPNPGREEYLLGFKDIDEAFRRERSLSYEMEMQRDIINGLGSEYFSILLLNLSNGQVSVFRADNSEGETIADYCKKNDYDWEKVIFNYDESVVNGVNHEEFVKKLSRGYILCQDEDYSFVYEAIRPERGAVYYQVRITYVDDANAGRVAVIGTRSIDEVIKKERESEKNLQDAVIAAQAANKAKTEFLFNMSHDIRTPMNAIMGFTELIKKKIDDKEAVRHYIEKIETSNEFLLSLINNVLEMARIESGKESLDEAICDIERFMDSLHSVFEVPLREKNVSLAKNIDIKHKDIWADETKLREVFLNIMSNAVKYTQDGGSITVSLKEIPSDRTDYELYQTIIEDTGIGMSEDFLPHIFDEFSREKSTTSSGVFGTGLGMPIVKKLVDLMGGEISVESMLGVGTKFTVTLPHRIANQEKMALNSTGATQFTRDVFEGRRILLAEDNDLNAEIAMSILEEEGMLVERAEDGIICVAMLEKAPANYYDMILMDVQMPNMDGYKATQLIRQLPDVDKSNIPIVAMTANAFEEDKKNAYKIGMNAHLGKPIQIEHLRNTIGNILTRAAYGVDAYKYWRDRFMECAEIADFKMEYMARGLKCGCFAYEATGNEEILYADDTILELFNCNSFEEFQSLVGGSFKSMVHPDDIEKVEQEIKDQIQTSSESVDRVKYRIITKDGRVLTIDDIGRKMYIQNGKAVFFVFIVDIDD